MCIIVIQLLVNRRNNGIKCGVVLIYKNTHSPYYYFRVSLHFVLSILLSLFLLFIFSLVFVTIHKILRIKSRTLYILIQGNYDGTTLYLHLSVKYYFHLTGWLISETQRISIFTFNVICMDLVKIKYERL